MWADIFTAIALFLVLEGLFPFLSPNGFKRRMQQLVQFPDRVLRTIGLASMALGVVLLYAVR